MTIHNPITLPPMSFDRQHGSRSMRAIARIQTATCGNKALAFFALFASFLLVHYFSSTSTLRRPYHSPRVSKRHGIGAGETGGSSELVSALRRKSDGRAAVAIIRVIGTAGGDDDDVNETPDRHPDVRYLVQLKSHDYPIEAFRGTVCLMGGNANIHDEMPLDTLKRELNEELHRPDWVDAIDAADVIDDSPARTAAASRLAEKPSLANSTAPSPPAPGTVRYLGTTLHFQGADLIDRPEPYAFACALYEITLRPDQLPPVVIHPRGATVEEGHAALLVEDQLVRHSDFAWGYEHTMEEYFGRTIEHKQTGTSVSDMNDRTWEEMMWTPTK